MSNFFNCFSCCKINNDKKNTVELKKNAEEIQNNNSLYKENQLIEISKMQKQNLIKHSFSPKKPRILIDPSTQSILSQLNVSHNLHPLTGEDSSLQSNFFKYLNNTEKLSNSNDLSFHNNQSGGMFLNNLISITNNISYNYIESINNCISNHNINVIDSICPSPIMNVNEKKKLILSGELFYNGELVVSENGIKNSLRNKQDNCIYFGYKKKYDNQNICYNDYIINFNIENFYKKNKLKKIEENFDDDKEEDDDFPDLETSRVFKIIYLKNREQYCLSFIHNSLILYYKINELIFFNIDKDYYFILGKAFLTITVKILKSGQESISVKVEFENSKSRKYIFKKEDTPIKIGRSNCEIIINRSCISKFHSSIEYCDINKKFYFKDNNSTNGSTLLMREDDCIPIKGTMFFKLEDVSFKIQESKEEIVGKEE